MLYSSLKAKFDQLLTLSLQIFTVLDDPEPFSKTSKRFAAIARQPFFRARWLLKHYPHYEVLFQAIARPSLLDVELLRVLLNTAPLSRHLVQLLHLLHNPVEVGRNEQFCHINWGTSVKFSVYVAIMAEAMRLYGDLSFRAADLDDHKIFTTYGLQWDMCAEPPASIIEIMTKGRYMPLPIGFDTCTLPPSGDLLVYPGSRQRNVEHVLAWQPHLAPYILAGGE